MEVKKMKKGSVVSTILIAVLLTLSTLVASSKAMSSPLVGYWKFDEGSGNTANDSSGNNNIGTLMNGAHWVNGISGTAIGLDGIDDYVTVPTSPSLTITGNHLTAELWIKPASTLNISTPLTVFMDKGNEYGFLIGPHAANPTPDGKIWFFIGLDVGGWKWEGIQTTSEQWEPNTWCHIAGTYDGSDLKVYVNGTLESSRPLSGNLMAQGIYPLSIGSYTLGTLYFFQGSIDAARVYNRAKTAGEILRDSGKASPKLKLTPDTGIASTMIACSGFTDASAVIITWNEGKVPTVPGLVITDPSGNLTALISIPSQTVPGTYIVKATDESGNTASASFTVINTTGPQGPKGDTGSTGVQGPIGHEGEQGPPGEMTANQLILSGSSVVVALLAISLAIVAIARKRS